MLELNERTVPSGVFLKPARFSLDRSANLEGGISANNKTVHSVNSLREKYSPTSCAAKQDNPLETSHVSEYAGNGGVYDTPLITTEIPLDVGQMTPPLWVQESSIALRIKEGQEFDHIFYRSHNGIATLFLTSANTSPAR